MLSTDSFVRFAKTVVPFLHVTSHLKGEKHPHLLAEKGGAGWPYVVALDGNGVVVAKLKGDRNVGSFRKMMARGEGYVSLREKSHKTTKEEVELYEADERLGHLSLEEARTRVASIPGLSPERRTELLVLPLVKAKLGAADTKAKRVEAGDDFWKMYEEGRIPTQTEWVQRFFLTIMDAADAEGRPERFRAALTELEKRFANDPGADHFFEVEKERLQEIEKRAAKKKAPPPSGPPGGGDK